jgi:hypothetical protein
MQYPFGRYMPMGSISGGYSKPLDLSNMGRCARGGRSLWDSITDRMAPPGPLTKPIRVKRKVRTAEQILSMWDQLQREFPNPDTSKLASYMCQKCPEFRRGMKVYLQDGHSRSGAVAHVLGTLRQHADA